MCNSYHITYLQFKKDSVSQPQYKNTRTNKKKNTNYCCLNKLYHRAQHNYIHLPG